MIPVTTDFGLRAANTDKVTTKFRIMRCTKCVNWDHRGQMTLDLVDGTWVGVAVIEAGTAVCVLAIPPNWLRGISPPLAVVGDKALILTVLIKAARNNVCV